jgi:hypothetical protein
MDQSLSPSGQTEFKGKDGKQVTIEQVNTKDKGKQLHITSKNANPDLERLIELINRSESPTAINQFTKQDKYPTKINFVFDNNGPPGLFGLHQPHGTRPDGSRGALEFKDGRFMGKADFITDKKGNTYYKEATITIYPKEIQKHYKAQGDFEREVVATAVHEFRHDLDPRQVERTKKVQGMKTYGPGDAAASDAVYHPTNRHDGAPAKNSPGALAEQVREEIIEAQRRQQQKQPQQKQPQQKQLHER